MITVTVNASKQYNVLVGGGLLKKSGELIAQKLSPGTAAIITDSNVAPLYGDAVTSSLTSAGFNVSCFIFPAGEQSKTIATYAKILNFLAESKLTRSDVMIALGGGVAGDMAGFAAATYMRGIPFVQLPTTFLAAVDSSVGGKTAVDLRAGKNLAGAFWQPELVICDCETFQTLPKQVFADGIAESLKHGLIADTEYFQALASGGIMENIESIVARGVEIKRAFVEADERESGPRKLLNFGHTIGHAIEACSAYGVPHGHAVAIGMAYATRAAEKMGFGGKGLLTRVLAALQKHNLPTECPFSAEDIYLAALGDKKRGGAAIDVVYLDGIGKAALKSLSLEELREFISLALEG